jgi:hypothetical protein
MAIQGGSVQAVIRQYSIEESREAYANPSRLRKKERKKERNGYRLSWLTNSALVFEPKCGGMGGGGGCGVSAIEYSCTHGVLINFRDLTPYLTYGWERIC